MGIFFLQITFTCSNCQTALEVAASDIGKDVECPSCTTVTTVPRQEPGTGTTIGGFYIKSLIGVGGSGNVFLATQLSMDRDIALKVLSAAVTKDPEDLERFMNEVRITARLEHPNIISAYEAGEDDGYYYMAMAYVNGMPLDKKIKYSEKGRLTEKKALRITKKMVLALSYAWTEQGMLHRDIKPENILLDSKGEPKLADLGLSSTRLQAKRVTSHGTIMGTPNYMSSEQIDDLGNADVRSDIYSLGATLYQMLTGKIPFESDSVVSTFNLIATGALIHPKKYNSKLSIQCITIIEKMLAKDPTDRYQTWKEVLDDLTKALNGRQVTTPRLTAGKSAIAPISLAPRNKRVIPGSPTQVKSSAGAKLGVAFGSVFIVIIVLIGIGKVSSVQQEKVARRQVLLREAAHKAEVQEEHARLAERYNLLMAYISDNADNYGGCVVKLKRALRSDLANSIYADRIHQKLNSMVADRKSGIESVWGTLKQQAQELYDAGQIDEALQVLRSYAGKYAVDIKGKRYSYADSLERKSQDQIRSSNAKEKAANKALKDAMMSISDALIDMNLSLVSTLVADVDAAEFPDKQAATWKRISKDATDAVASRRTVCSSFRTDKGKDILVSLKNGDSKELRVTRVSGSTVYARSSKRINGDYRTYKFSVADISESEYFKRIGTRKSSGLEIIRGLLAFNADAPEKAQKYFASANCKLGDIIDAKTRKMSASSEF